MEEEKAFLVPREKGALSEAVAQLGVCNLEVTHFKWPLCVSLPWGRRGVQKPSLCSLASAVPLPSPQGHLPSTLPCIPLPCIVRPFSTYSPLPFLPRTPKPPPRPPQASYPNTLSPGRLAVLLPCGACPHRCRAVVSVQVSHQMGWIGSETQEWKEWGVGGAQSPREGRASSWSTP